MNTAASRGRRLLELFDEWVDRPGAEREAMLERLAGEDAGLGAELEGMLEAEGATRGSLDRSATELAPDLLAGGERRFGSWRTVRPLGRGGMGMVYLVERADGQFEQRAALKLIPEALDGSAARSRFLRERQILARLEHPKVARLLDGGVTEEGNPFLVMELAEGPSVTEHADEQALTLEQRLGLFLEICAGVEYAHRNLVVHRDLKPSNVVVTADGVKLLDFGIAKTLDQDDAALTRTEWRAFTPAYSSPEQVSGDQVTTQSDVYSLGLLLYELLTGERAQAVDSQRPSTVERVVCEVDPALPSARLAGSQEPPPGLVREARQRGRRLLGDLDAITMKALRKEPELRYASVEALSSDVRRTLRGEPVSARAASVPYRVRKFVRRNLIAVGASAAVAGSLLVGLATSLWQARVASAQRDLARLEARKAEQVSTYLAELFNVSNPLVEQPEDLEGLTARDLLDRGAERLELDLKDQPAVQADLLIVFGEVYKNLSALSEAEVHIEAALQQRRDLHGDDHLEVAESLVLLGTLRQEQARYQEAEDLYREALSVQRSQLTAPHKDLADTEYYLAVALVWQEDASDEAEALLRSALAMRQQVEGPESLAVAYASNSLGGLLADLGRHQDAEQHLSRTLRIRRSVLGDDHPSTAVAVSNLANALRAADRPAEAEPLFREALETLVRQLGDSHQFVAIGLNNLADVLERQDKLAEAETTYREAQAVFERMQQVQHPVNAVIRSKWGGVLAKLGAAERAEPVLVEALEGVEAAFGPEHSFTAQARARLDSARAALERGTTGDASSGPGSN